MSTTGLEDEAGETAALLTRPGNALLNLSDQPDIIEADLPAIFKHPASTGSCGNGCGSAGQIRHDLRSRQAVAMLDRTRLLVLLIQ